MYTTSMLRNSYALFKENTVCRNMKPCSVVDGIFLRNCMGHNPENTDPQRWFATHCILASCFALLGAYIYIYIYIYTYVKRLYNASV
jgi:hypothetical protein